MSYTPAKGTFKLKNVFKSVKFCFGILKLRQALKIRAADAKEVGVGNPAEETCCHPNTVNVTIQQQFVNTLSAAAISWLYLAGFFSKVHGWLDLNRSNCS
ncbi:MAG TPA: hypothetical protein VHG71_02905, partial [Verrucomicrobiae bacterium]|nr:hypothetical protein [Verrucomicrobiae bacterium]